MRAMVAHRDSGEGLALPAETYTDAVNVLVVIAVNPEVSDQAYDLCASLVARIYWRTEKRVRRDVMVAARRIGA